jgi:DNA-binding beta-propeller fold protein YncE
MKQLMYKMVVVVILLPVFLIQCRQPDPEDVMLDNYNLGKPEKFSMPESLLEVSGITFNNGKSDTIYAINDEEGRFFRLGWKVKKQLNVKFGKKGDYEDVAIVNGKVIILKSNGHLFSFPFAESTEEEVSDVIEYSDLLPKGEYEGIYGDQATGKLYVICKNCKADDPKQTVEGYIFQIGDAVYPAGAFSIAVDEIKSFTGKVKKGFQPSALAKNPVTGEWFVLSGLNKMLVITDSAWKVTAARPLSGNTFNQPEGIAFDNTGNLYISNEGDDISDGNILKFKREGK